MSIVNLTKQIITTNGRRFVPVAKSHNGRVRADWVIYEGREVYYPWGHYYLDWRDANKVRHREAAGSDATEANSRRLRKQAELNFNRHSIPAIPHKERNLERAIEAYLKEIRQHKRRRRIENSTTALMYFKEYCRKDVDNVTRLDLLRFTAWLQDDKFVPARRAWDIFGYVVNFLKAYGVPEFARLADWPDFIEAAC